MKKLLAIAIFSLVLVLGCKKKEDPAPALPTKESIAGYWKVSFVQKNGQSAKLEDYPSPSPIITHLSELYYFFDSQTQFELIAHNASKVVILAGEWNLQTDVVTTDYAGAGSTANYKVISFSQNQLRVTDTAVPDYTLILERIAKDDYPETMMTAVADNYTFTSVDTKAMKGNSITMSGTDINGHDMSIRIEDFGIIAGHTYPIDGSTYFGFYFFSQTDGYMATEGTITIQKYTASYISATFEFTAENNDGEQVVVTQGVFKAILQQ